MFSKFRIFLSISGFAKVIIIVTIIYAAVLIHTYNSKLRELRSTSHHISYVNNKDVKYILQWTRRFSAPFDLMGQGNSVFIKNKCAYNNCFVTDDSNYFLSHSEFDAIAFNGRDVDYLWLFPAERSQKQKYIFGAMESPDNFPVCNPIYDGFFNWTWTYRLDSDFRFGYITIFDLNGTFVGPALDMQWPNQLEPISNELKETLSTKSKAGAWFVSHCNSKGKRENFISSVQEELNRFGLSVDIYGACGSFSCPKTNADACFDLIKKDYYFYFSLENSFSEDYVTEKLLTALHNHAIPVVFGAADYTRFLPPGSYLDGLQLGAKALAEKINEIISNKTMFYDYFRWTNHYVYRDTGATEDICKLCEMMNNDEKVREISEWPDFRIWWNGARHEKKLYNC